MKKTIMAALAGLLLIAAGCGNDSSWVYQSGGMKASPGLYTIYQVLALSEAELIVYEENAGYVPEPNKEFFKLTAAGQPVSAWVNAKAKEGVAEYFAVLHKFAALGLELNADDLSKIESLTESVWQSSGVFNEKNGIAREDLYNFYACLMKMDCILVNSYGKGGEYEVGDKEIAEYIINTYAMADLLMMARPYGELNSPEDEFTRTMAEEYLNRLQEGELIEELALEWMLLNAETQEYIDALEMPDKRDMRVIVSQKNKEEIGQFVYEAIMETPAGASRIVEDEFAFLIVDRIDFTVETEGFQDNRNDILREMRTTDLEQKITEWGRSLEMIANQPALKRYTPQKIRYDD